MTFFFLSATQRIKIDTILSHLGFPILITTCLFKTRPHPTHLRPFMKGFSLPTFQILDSSARRRLLRPPGGCEAAAGGRGRGGRSGLQGGHAPQAGHQVRD